MGKRRGWPSNLLSNLDPQPNGCIWFTGCVNWSGYGQLRKGGKLTSPHRAMYELLIGPIPAGMDIDHTCHNGDECCPGGVECMHRRCVNPGHLEPVTRRVNLQRAKRKTHCIHGHEYTPENTYFRPGTDKRICRTCARAADAKRVRVR